MPEANQTANPTDARQASMSRVQTQETILAKLIPQEAAKVPPEGGNTSGEPNKEGEAKPKKTASERIQELATKRNEAEAKAEAAERKAAELEARVQMLQAQAKPLEAEARPVRSAYATDDDYTDAVAEWKTKRVLAEREQQQAQARAEAEQAEIAAQWSKRQEAFMKVVPDYAEIIAKSEVKVPNHIHEAMLESEYGPQVAMFLALHPEEAKKLSTMRAVSAIKRFRDLEKDLADIEVEERAQDKDKAPPQVPKSKAPPPIDTIRSVPASSGSSSNDYEEYKRRREAEKRK